MRIQSLAAYYNYYDPYGRLTRMSISVPGDTNRYILTDATFTGFDGGITPRSVRYRSYSEWTPEADAATADPKTVSTLTENLDEMGRLMNRIVDLGADYNGQSVVVNALTYDSLGRPSFEADPFPSIAFGQHYGTTFTYFPDGRSACAIQGQGPQTLTTTDESVDRYPTCTTYSYENHQALTQTQGPNELAAAKAQSNAVNQEAVSGTGLVLQRTRTQNGITLEQVDYRYDRLGQQTRVTRWADPHLGSGQVQWSWVNDSFGHILTATEPSNVSKSYTYDAWGQVSKYEWRDSTGIIAIQRGVRFVYDGLSRMLNMRETTNGEDVTDTLKEYFYDSSSGQPQHLDTQFLNGHLSWARTGNRSIFLGYDALGRLTTQSRSDAGGPSFYAERQTLGPQGELTRLDLLLPDVNNVAEHILYDYDSARRMTLIRFQDASGVTELWKAIQTDIFGRRLQTRLGNGATKHATYRTDHRRELKQRRTESNSLTRLSLYGSYDGEMLLKSLAQSNNLLGTSHPTITNYTYDARSSLGQVTIHDPTGTIADLSYAYDGLGNLIAITDGITAANSVELRTDKFDRDRLCVITPPGAPNTPCSYNYDALGNVRGITGTQTKFYSYDGSGRMISARFGPAHADLEYDPFGALSALRTVNQNIERRELFYGDAALVSFFNGSGQPVNVGTGPDAFHSYLERQIQSPEGIIAVMRRTNTGATTMLYPDGELQGTRATFAANGTAAETIDYGPYGSITEDSQTSDSLSWFPYQWNGGHTLDSFRLVAIGQRVLDGATGRFLQRDPSVNVSTATTAHPYAFAWNNPVGFTDPSGAEPKKDNGGEVASGLAAVGKLLYRAPTDPGEKIEPYIETRWACNADHDCISAVESQYPLTDFEKSLRAEYHSGPRKIYTHTRDYHVVMDRLSGAVLGYAFFQNTIDIYDRSGKIVSTLGNERGLEPSWLQPADLIAGPLSGALRGAFGSKLVRSGIAAAEDTLADDALSDTADAFAARRPPPYQVGNTNGARGLTNLRTGQITISNALIQRTKE
ncbi:MAG TPA: RHS repeat-associated core domain-containing protein, partial [Nitrospiraceae bacterium]|nr:RHS repeat-associated core domain-containing protein [Nitrospiraceae bacterium]